VGGVRGLDARCGPGVQRRDPGPVVWAEHADVTVRPGNAAGGPDDVATDRWRFRTRLSHGRNPGRTRASDACDWLADGDLSSGHAQLANALSV